MHPHDIDVRNEGNIWLLFPTTRRSKEWLWKKAPEGAQWFGHALVVEHRFVEDWLVRWQVACAEDDPSPDQRDFDEYDRAMRDSEDRWVVAAAGTEPVCLDAEGRRVRRVFNPRRQKHGYLVLDTDIVEED